MPLLSSKNLISTLSLKDEPSTDGKPKRRTAKIEFQAYAYRLAHDLNDLVNLRIYMRLAKNVERSLMERAYSFVSDSTSQDKGRLFLWKLKLLRKEIEKDRNKGNFSSEYVFKLMKIFRNKFATELYKRLGEDLFLDVMNFYTESIKTLEIKKKNPSLLFIGIPPVKLINLAIQNGYKVTVIDYSSQLNTLLKKELDRNKKEKVKVILKNPIDSKLKDKSFDQIVMYNYWQITSKDLEVRLIELLKRLLKDSGKILLNFRISDVTIQEWKSYKLEKEEFMYFIKQSNFSEVLKLFNDKNFEISSQILSNKSQFVEFNLNPL